MAQVDIDTTLVTNDILKQSLAELISKFSKGLDVASDQLPVAVQEVVLHGRVLYTATAVFFGLLFILGLCLFPMAIKSDKVEDAPWVVVCLVGSLLGGMVSIIINFSDFIQVWFAPKMYIIEYAAHLLKGGC